MFKKIFLFQLIVIFIVFPFAGKAAVLYFDPGEAEYGPGDEFAVDIKVQVNTGCINTIEGEIFFPRENLVLKDFLTGESILNLWVDYPEQDQIPEANREGRLHFSGGIPGGYCGQIPGDPGDSNIVGKLLFAVPRFTVGGGDADKGVISLGPRTRVMLNDGLGTVDALATRTAEIYFADRQVNPDLDWDRLLARDTTPPEPFVIELRRSPSVFDGDYYLIFSTVDKQSGVDHYEVLEIGRGGEVGLSPELSWWEKLLGREKPAPQWQKAAMPYRLADQELKSLVRVKAVDRAGNERMVEYVPPVAPKTPAGYGPADIIPWALAGLALILALTAIAWLIFKKIKNKPHVEEN